MQLPPGERARVLERLTPDERARRGIGEETEFEASTKLEDRMLEVRRKHFGLA